MSKEPGLIENNAAHAEHEIVVYTMEDAADYLGCHDNTLRNWMKRQDFPVLPIRTKGGNPLFTRVMLDEVKRWSSPAA